MSATPASPITEHFADVNGIRLHYARTGAGPLIILLHGFPEFWRTWAKILPALGRDFLAVAPDLRGFNLSDKPDGVDAYRASIVGDDIIALADHLGAERFVLAGHDWGGFIAWDLARRRPDRIERLVIVNSPNPVIFARELLTNPDQQRASAYMAVFRKPDAEQTFFAGGYPAFVAGALHDVAARGLLSDDDRAAYAAAASQAGALTGGLNYYRASQLESLAPPDASAESLARYVIPMPTLVIWGERDEYLLTGNLRGLETVVPNLTLVRVPHASHWITHEEPALIAEAMRTFLLA